MPNVLEVSGVSVNFGGVQALREVSVGVEFGEIHGLIGPNGSGKTTLLNAVCGFVQPRSGRINLNGVSIERLPTHRRAAAGLARTFQGAAVFEEFDATENVVVGLHLHDSQTFLRACIPFAGEAAALKNRALARAALAHVGLDAERETLAGALPFGGQRLVDFARATVRSPEVLLLDEPAAGLNTARVTQLAALIRDIRAAGMSVLLVEHHLELVMGLCDRITVLNFGQTIAVGSPDEVRRNEAVIEAYLGPGHGNPSSH
jgi:branched-chain amino acid transport system ATP-binding protein